EDKGEEIASRFFQEKGKSLVQQCLQALSHLGQSRLAVDPLKERDPNTICHISNAVVALADAIALLRDTQMLATGGVVVEESSSIKETKRRISRCINASYSAVRAMPESSLQSAAATFYEGCSEANIREIAYGLLKEASALSYLIHDSEAAYRKSVSGGFFTVEDALQYIAGLPVRDCSKAAFCASMVRTTLK
ncbi:MAG: hypothetical protein PV344_01965, partial [Anaplasma sp.]|nr:hypothetical protein [Anaplasma sp.]